MTCRRFKFLVLLALVLLIMLQIECCLISQRSLARRRHEAAVRALRTRQSTWNGSDGGQGVRKVGP